MKLRPPVWAFALALTCAAACLSAAALAPAIVRFLVASRLPVFPGMMGNAYYEIRMREVTLCWALLLPVLLLTAGSVRAQWRTLASHPDGAAARSSHIVAGWLLVVLALVLAVPRDRTGDEPTYLAMADSVAKRGSLVLESGRTDLHLSAVSVEPRSVHSPGIGILIGAPMSVLGAAAVPLVLAAIAFSFLLCLREMLKATVGQDLATLATMAIGASFPVVTFAPLVLPEMAGALGLAFLHWRLVLRRRTDLACGVALAVLPWLHVRFIAPALIYALWGLLALKSQRRRASLWLILPLVASFTVMGWLHLRWFGSPSPFAMWGGRTDLLSRENPIAGTLGLLVDQQYGLLVWAPIFLLAPLGLWQLARRSRAEALVLGAVVAAAVGPGILHEWWGGWSPAARFVVPVTGQLALLSTLGLERALRGGARDRAVAGVILTVQLAVGAACALVPGKVFGTFQAEPRNYYLDLLARALGTDPTLLLPSLRVSPGGWTVVAAAFLVTAWVAGSLLWARRLARLGWTEPGGPAAIAAEAGQRG